MASKFCTKCGSPTIAGKRFCGKCGQPIAQPDSSPELTGKTTDTEPIQQASSLPDAVPQAAVLTSSQTPSKEVRVLSDSDVNVEIPSSQPQNNRPVEPTPVSHVSEPVSENGSFPSYLSEEKAPDVVDKPVTGSPPDYEISAPSSNKPWWRKALFAGSAALVLILAVCAVWFYVTHVRAKHSQAPVTIATAQPLIAPNSSSPSGSNDKPSAATPITTQQGLPVNSNQSVPSGDVLLKSLPKPTGYVNDFAHVLSPEAVARLDGICGQLDHSQASAQVAVVTIETLNGADIADFAKQLFNKWGIGPKASNRGVLVLLAVNDHKYRIATGYGLESILTDSKAAEIGRSAAPLLHVNDFDRGVTSIVTQVAQVIDNDAKMTLNTAPRPSAPPPVPFGGTVVFTSLSGDRLSFIFDHQAWQPLISRQPDGTQKLTLRSLKQGNQTQCDVEWKVIK